MFNKEVFVKKNLAGSSIGQYTTELGQLTPLGIQYAYSHFSTRLQRSPAWERYQSEDPLKPYYKPLEDIKKPDPYEEKPNLYWSRRKDEKMDRGRWFHTGFPLIYLIQN